jgi:hypothetical protein
MRGFHCCCVTTVKIATRAVGADVSACRKLVFPFTGCMENRVLDRGNAADTLSQTADGPGAPVDYSQLPARNARRGSCKPGIRAQ